MSIYELNEEYGLELILGDSKPIFYDGMLKPRTLLECGTCKCVRLAREFQDRTIIEFVQRGKLKNWTVEKHCLFKGSDRSRFVCPNCESYVPRKDLGVKNVNDILAEYPRSVKLVPHIKPSGLIGGEFGG